MKRINRASDTIGIKGSIPIRIETFHPNKDYTIEEQILLLYLLSLPPTWNLKQSWVIKRYIGVMGRERVKKAWASLKLKGHLVKMKGEKFTDVYWLVFESTSNNQNLDNLNSVDLELVKNNTDIIDTDNIDTDNTSSSILGKTKIDKKELPQHLQPGITTQGSYLKNELIKSADFLVRATKLGAEIFEFDSEYRFNKLEKLIGNEEFEKIKPALRKWILAKNQLK